MGLFFSLGISRGSQHGVCACAWGLLGGHMTVNSLMTQLMLKSVSPVFSHPILCVERTKKKKKRVQTTHCFLIECKHFRLVYILSETWKEDKHETTDYTIGGE